MNLKELKKKRENIISIGFGFETFLFFISGYFLDKYFIVGLVTLVISFWLAFWVGDRIAKNAVINFKYGLE